MKVKELKALLDNHLKWLRGEADGKRAFLQGADLRLADLRGADLQRADLRGAYLQGADLRGAYLQRAYLRGADLQGAYLQGADLQGADLRDADLQEAQLQDADLQEAQLQGAQLQGADLRGAQLQGAQLQGADLQGAYLQRAYLRGTVLDGINWLSYLGIVPDNQGNARAYKVTTADGGGINYAGLDYVNNFDFTAPLCTDVYQQCAEGVNLATLAWCLNEREEGRRLFLMEFSCAPENICVPVASDGKFRVAKCRKVGECDWHGNLLGTRKGNEAEANP